MRPSSPSPIRDVVSATVIAGVALGLLAPALRPARDAKASICLDHLRRIGAAARMYSDDWGGCLVPYAIASSGYSARYTALLYPHYVQDIGVFACPADHLDRSTLHAPSPTTFGVNWYISREVGSYWPSSSPQRLTAVKDPGHTIWAADTAPVSAETAALPPAQWREDLKSAATADIYYFYLPSDPETGAASVGWTTGNWESPARIYRPFPRHGGRVNAAFYDGHAESVAASQFDPAVTQWGKPGCLWDNVAG
jgi:prepilin-type processing-associated H-X9-DG protein